MSSVLPSDSVRGSLMRTAFRMALGVALILPPAQLDADILRGGAPAGAAPAAAGGSGAGQAPPAATNQARANANDSLARTT
ncbi:MAG: filamentous hemagglutinin N-terminal protein, partial [Akkermansiaceae bacterium]|nr:filamentous hemagglutinin N-terminal protein [Akkermansiaceae bacterium]